MSTTPLSLNEIYELARKTLINNGCNELNAEAVANTVTFAERDGSISHGLFRIPGYVASLRSKKVRGNASPLIKHISQSIIQVDGDRGFAPYAIQLGIPILVEATKKNGIGILAIKYTHHFAAFWYETEALAEED